MLLFAKKVQTELVFPYQGKRGVYPAIENGIPGFCSQLCFLFQVLQWNVTNIIFFKKIKITLDLKGRKFRKHKVNR